MITFNNLSEAKNEWTLEDLISVDVFPHTKPYSMNKIIDCLISFLQQSIDEQPNIKNFPSKIVLLRWQWYLYMCHERFGFDKTCDFAKSHTDFMLGCRWGLYKFHSFDNPIKNYLDKKNIDIILKKFYIGLYGFVTSDELKKHRYTNYWICVNKKVWNVTNFIDSHPGGRENILKYTGSVATKKFNDIHQAKNVKVGKILSRDNFMGFLI